jgi:serine/threonine-protein kinase
MKNCPTCQGSYPSNYAVCPQDGTPLQDATGWNEGSVIRGKYRILAKVGQGGMGAVYKASHLAFDELRALKVISPELLHDELFVKRFKHEAVITRKLQHPNAVRVEDIDEAEDGRPFIVMEFIEGTSLKKLIQETGPLPINRVCLIVKQVASALDAAHRLGMVHRDIKPDNIALVDAPEGELVKVLDFGIAKVKEARLGAAHGMTLTGTGVVIGTPQYMSPEQAMGKRGDELDGRSDLYSLGVVMYEMLTADLPFKADTTMAMLLAHLQQPPRPIRSLRPDVDIPEPVANLTMRLLEKDPAKRPQNAAALIAEIEMCETGGASLGATRVMKPSAVMSPAELRAAQAAVRQGPGRASMVAGDVVPVPPSPVQPRAVTPRRPSSPAVLPSEPKHQSRWGLWVGMVILLAGVGGGGWYVTSHRSIPASAIPASTAPPVSGEIPQPTTAQPVSGAQNASGPGTSKPESTQPVAHEPVVPPPEAPPRKPTAAAQHTHQHEQASPVQVAPPVAPEVTTAPAVDPKKIRGAITMGDFDRNQGRYDEAIKDYSEGLKLDPKNPDLLRGVEKARKAKEAEDKVLLH